MGEVIDLAVQRALIGEPTTTDPTEDVSNFTGPAKCLACSFTWTAVAPVGAVALECPHCGCDRGRITGPCWPSGDHWMCDCGCDVFVLRRSGAMCISCGITPTGWVD